MTVVVAGSTNNNSFAVINCSDPASPVNTLVTPPFSGSCVVDCAGSLAAVGNANGGQVAIYDISSPGTPVWKATVATGFGGIGAISCNDTNVLAGQQDGPQVVLISVTSPAEPQVVSTYSTAIESIASVALSGSLAVASGPNSLYFVVLNYANPASPSQVRFTPGTGGVDFNGVIVCDLDGTHAAVADGSGGAVHLFNVSGGTPALLGTYQSDQAGITSISVSGTTVAAASTNDSTVTLASFPSGASPSGADTPTALAGACVKLAGSFLAAGAANGFDVGVFSVSGTSATALGTDDTTLGSIGTLGITSDVTAEPGIAVSPASLAFGTVDVNTTSAGRTLTLTNDGTAPLEVTGLATGGPVFAASPSGTLPAIAPGASQAVTVTFTPSAVQSYSATLTMTTNDPSHRTVSVSLSGTGGKPAAAAWTPAALAFGTVVAGETETADLTISNSGSTSLRVTGIAAGPSVFTATPEELTVAPAGGQPVTVSFAPAAAEGYAGSLAFQTSDPAHPSVSVPLSGGGLSPAQPGLEVFAVAGNGQLGRIWQVTAGGGWSPWDGNTWQAGAPLIAASSAVGTNADGRLEVFGRSPDGNLGHAYQLTPQGLWSPWKDIQPLMPLGGEPQVFANADGRLEVFAVGPDGKLGHAWQNAASTTTNWSGWQDLGPTITTDPAVARNADGRLEVFANGEGTTGPPALGHMFQNVASTSTDWSSWTNFDDFPLNSWPITGNPAVAQNADGRLEVFAAGKDGNLGHIWQNAASTTTDWSGWQADLGPAIISDPAVARNADGRLEVFANAPTTTGPPELGHIWQTTPGGGWSGWTAFSTIPGEWTIRSGPAVAQNPDGRLEVFARGTDGTLGHAWQNAASTTTDWSGWEDLGPAISSNAAAAANSTGGA